MTGPKVSRSISIYIFCLIFAAYIVPLAVLAKHALGKDIFAGVQPKVVHSEVSKRLSHLDPSARSRGGLMGPYVRDKWALLVGVNRYQDNAIRPMRIAHNDVALISSLLKEPMIGRFPAEHVQTLLGRGATRDAIQEAILDSWLVKKALPNDLIFLYFSARTLPIPQENDLCLCTYDTLASEAEVSGLKLSDILLNLRKRTQCSQIICVLDCAAASKATYAKAKIPSVDEISSKTGVSVISSGDFNEETPACNAGTISSFALYFADALRNSSGAFSLGMLVSYIQDNLNKESQGLGTSSTTVRFVSAAANPRASDLVIGTPIRRGGSHIAFGHDMKTLPLERPDLVASNPSHASSGGVPHGRIVNGTVDDEEEEESKFSKVDFVPWMDKMKKDIRAKWQPPKGLEQRKVVAIFTAKRDGTIVQSSIVGSSGHEDVDKSALDALKAASPLEHLPEGAPESVQIRYVFDWHVSAK